MKRLMFFLMIACATLAFAKDDVLDLLNKAKACYEKGDKNGTLNAIEQAQALLEKSTNTKKPKKRTTPDDYIKLKSWTPVQRKPADYEGKMVQITAKNYGITSDGKLWIYGVSPMCNYDESIRKDLLELEREQSYTFYGTVQRESSATSGPVLNVDFVE